jgi:hypothetical protein
VSVEKEAVELRKAGDSGGCSVKPIAQDGVMKAGKVDAYLVSTAGTDAYFEVAVAPQVFDQAVLGQSGAAGAEL